MQNEKEKVYSLLEKVPRGKVTTYYELAKATGTHSRVVAVFMAINKDPQNVPCYKVVRSDGRVGGYSGPGGKRRKVKLLEKDGITVKDGRIDLKKHMFRFTGSEKP